MKCKLEIHDKAAFGWVWGDLLIVIFPSFGRDRTVGESLQRGPAALN